MAVITGRAHVEHPEAYDSASGYHVTLTPFQEVLGHPERVEVRVRVSPVQPLPTQSLFLPQFVFLRLAAHEGRDGGCERELRAPSYCMYLTSLR